MFSFQHVVYISFLVVQTGYAFSADLESNDPIKIKVHLNGTWKLPIQSRHSIHNVIVSRVLENGTFLEVFSVNSDEMPHIHDRRYENRTKPKRSQQGKAVDILVSNAPSADGGNYSARVSSAHDTFTSNYTVFVIGRPTLPVISLNGKGLTVKEGGFRRFTCKSHSTTNPRNPDEPLLFRFIVNGMKVTEMTTQARFMEGYNELMVADITKADSHLNITCIVWEGDERELSSNNMRSFTLHVIDKIKYDYSDLGIHIQQRQIPRQQGATECHNTALIVMTVIWSIVTAILIVVIMVLLRRH